MGITPSTGALTDALPLELPQGRKGIQPALNLLYNSSGALGPAGLGWLSDIGHIEPYTADGVPQSTPFPEVLVTIAGAGTECVGVGAGEYRALNEAAYKDVRQVGASWEVYDANGVLYRFGSSVATQIAGAYWALDTVQDPNGNTITISYTLDSAHNYLYPSTIQYTGNMTTGEPGTSVVTLGYQGRTDTRISERDGFRQEMVQRLSTVTVTAEGQAVRTYTLNYAESDTTGRSLLQSAVLTGADGATSVTPRTYQYTQDTLGWDSTVATEPCRRRSTTARAKTSARASSTSMATTWPTSSTTRATCTWAGEGDFTSSSTWTASLKAVLAITGHGFANSDGSDTGTRLLDVNGDLRPDVVYAPSSGTASVFLNTGTGWAQDSSFSTSLQNMSQTFMAPTADVNPLCFPPADAGPDASPPDAGIDCNTTTSYTLPFALVRSNGDSPGVLFGDANGDGLVDILWSVDTDQALFSVIGTNGQPLHDVPAQIRAVYLNTGDGWTQNSPLSLGLPATAFTEDSHLRGFDAYDVNGDGLVDLVQTLSGSPQEVYLGNGSAWVVDTEYTASLQNLQLVSISNDTNQGLVELDYNSDGLIDLVQARTNLAAAAYRNTGSGWVLDNPVSSNLQSHSYAPVDANGNPQGFTFADINGDSKPDLIQALSGTGSTIELALGVAPDLLSGSTSLLGEVTSVVWGRSDQFDNASGGVQDLPLVLPVATQLARYDGRANTLSTTATYSGGAYVERQFRSFAQSAQTDSVGNVATYVQSQADHVFGQTLTASLSDSTGVRQQTVNTFQVVPITGSSTASQIQLTAVDTYQYDGAASTHIRVRMAYDAYLQLTEVDKDGDVTNPNDNGRTVYQHADNLRIGLVSPLSQITAYDSNNHVVGQGVILYDGLPQGQVAEGNPTSTTDTLLPGGELLTKTVTYDVYGNPTTVVDAAGDSSSYSYDTTSHTYRVTATDPLGRTLTSVYDPRFGIEVESVDLNGNATTRNLDVFGRVTEEILPGDQSSTYGTTSLAFSALGNASAQNVTIASTTQTGTANVYRNTVYFDGFAQVSPRQRRTRRADDHRESFVRPVRERLCDDPA
jgi:hypothetical protein